MGPTASPRVKRPSAARTAPLEQDSPSSSVGLLAGTRVLARRGNCRVETLLPGEDIITRDQGLVTCQAIKHHVCNSHAIWFAPGSLGDSRPVCDVILPADQPVLLRDWRAKALFDGSQTLVRAGTLVDGEFICNLGCQDMPLTILQFSQAHIFYAGGLEVAGNAVASPPPSSVISALG